MRKLLIALPVLFSHAVATAAPAPVPLSSSGPWNVDFADSMCVLSRPFAGGATNLAFRPSLVGDGVELVVLTPTKATKVFRTGKAVVAIDGKSAGNATFRAYNAAGSRLARIQFKEDEEFALAKINGALSISAGGEGRWLFNVTAIARALPTLKACQKQLRAAFGITDADLAPIVTYPKGTVSGLFSSNDYPQAALDQGQFGTVAVMVWVEVNGRVSTCTVVNTDAAPVLQQRTCDIIKERSRLTPAKDAQGKPVRGPSSARINWVLPS